MPGKVLLKSGNGSGPVSLQGRRPYLFQQIEEGRAIVWRDIYVIGDTRLEANSGVTWMEVFAGDERHECSRNLDNFTIHPSLNDI